MKDKNNIQDVIKNPARSISLPQRKYEPEYVRLGVEPEIKNVSIGPDPIPAQSNIENMETWSSVDGIIFDEDGNDIDIMAGHIIDNNDFVETTHFIKPKEQPTETKSATQNQLAQPKVGEYILMVLGKLITSGSFDTIQTKVKSIVYGDDDTFKQMNVSIDDIVVLKRIGIKIGVFLDEK